VYVGMPRLSPASALAALALLLAPSHAPAQSPAHLARLADSARIEIETGAIRGDERRLIAAGQILDRGATIFPNDPLLQHYQAYAIYRTVNLADSRRTAAEVTEYLDTARRLLLRSLARRPLPESYALLATIDTRLASLDAQRFDQLTEESARMMTEAVRVGPRNPRVQLLRGMQAVFTPVERGGGSEVAERLLTHAIVLFASDRPARGLPAWGRAEAHGWLGQVYQRIGRRDAAAKAYERALELEPGFNWVRQVLLPSLGR
jgi:tetratricopeptide (TPR) repeat protein